MDGVEEFHPSRDASFHVVKLGTVDECRGGARDAPCGSVLPDRTSLVLTLVNVAIAIVKGSNCILCISEVLFNLSTPLNLKILTRHVG